MSGALNDFQTEDSSPDVFHHIHSSESLNIALRHEQNCLWLVAARTNPTRAPKVSACQPVSDNAQPAWHNLPSLMSELKANTTPGNGASSSITAASYSDSIDTNVSAAWKAETESCHLVLLKMENVRWLSKLCQTSIPLPKPLADDWANQVSTLERRARSTLSLRSNGETLANRNATEKTSLAGDLKREIANQSVSVFAVNQQAILVDLVGLAARAITAAENGVIANDRQTHIPNIQIDSILDSLESKPSVDEKTLSQLLKESGATVCSENVAPRDDTPLQIKPTVTAKLSTRSLGEQKTLSIATNQTPKSKPSPTKNKRVWIGVGVISVCAAIIVGLFAIRSPAERSVSNKVESKESEENGSSAVNLEQTDALNGSASLTNSEQLDLSGLALPTEAVADAISLPSTSAGDAITSLSAGPGATALGELPGISIESLLTPEPSTNEVSGEPSIAQGQTSNVAINDTSNQSDPGLQTDVAAGTPMISLPGAADSVLPRTNQNLFDDEGAESDDSNSIETVASDAETEPSEPSKISVDLIKPLVTATVRGPEGLVRDQACAMVAIKSVEGLNVEPTGPWILTGRASDVRTLYRSEEGAAIKIYAKSNPSSAWKMQFAARLRITSQIEIPVDAKLVAQSLDQLMQMNVMLSQQLNTLNQLRSHPRVNRAALANVDAMIKSKITEVEQLVEVLHDASALIDLFKTIQTIDVTIAKSIDQLPQTENLEETTQDEE